MERTGGRATWSIAQLLWLPLLAGGAWFLVGADMGMTEVGDGEWTTHVFVAAPAAWFADPVTGGIGAALLAVGFILFGISRWQPDAARVPLTITRYASFALAGTLLFFLSLTCLVTWSGHVVDPGSAGLDWRFILSLRKHALDLAVGWTAALAGVMCWALSVGPAWHSFRDRARAPEA